jgi:hypothetical protein
MTAKAMWGSKFRPSGSRLHCSEFSDTHRLFHQNDPPAVRVADGFDYRRTGRKDRPWGRDRLVSDNAATVPAFRLPYGSSNEDEAPSRFTVTMPRPAPVLDTENSPRKSLTTGGARPFRGDQDRAWVSNVPTDRDRGIARAPERRAPLQIGEPHAVTIWLRNEPQDSPRHPQSDFTSTWRQAGQPPVIDRSAAGNSSSRFPKPRADGSRSNTHSDSSDDGLPWTAVGSKPARNAADRKHRPQPDASAETGEEGEWGWDIDSDALAEAIRIAEEYR